MKYIRDEVFPYQIPEERSMTLETAIFLLEEGTMYVFMTLFSICVGVELAKFAKNDEFLKQIRKK